MFLHWRSFSSRFQKNQYRNHACDWIRSMVQPFQWAQLMTVGWHIWYIIIFILHAYIYIYVIHTCYMLPCTGEPQCDSQRVQTWDHWDYDFIFRPWYRLSTLWSHVESGYFSMAASPHKGTKGAASIWIGNVFLETHTSFWVWALRNFAVEGVRLDHSLDPVDLPDHPGETWNNQDDRRSIDV